MKTEPTHPIHPTGDQRDMQPEFGLTKREHFMLEILKSYITAGSTGMPTPENLMQYTADTYNAFIEMLNQTP